MTKTLARRICEIGSVAMLVCGLLTAPFGPLPMHGAGLILSVLLMAIGTPATVMALAPYTCDPILRWFERLPE